MEKGIAPLLILGIFGILIVVGRVLYFNGDVRNFVDQEKILPTFTPQSSYSPTVTPTPSPNIVSVSTQTPSPTIPPLRSITISGFAYEDRNDDGSFNSDDPKIPNMQFYLYDSYKPGIQISTIYSDTQGNFSITLEVRRGLTVKPTTYNNFRPRTGEKTYTNTNNSLEFGFRSASAPVSNVNVGIVEGDIFHDANRNLVRDGGESKVYFYTLYLIDQYGSYYNTVENAQATDAGGHFKYMNLPVGRTFTIKLSNPTGAYDILRPETNINLTNTHTEEKNIQVPIYKY